MWAGGGGYSIIRIMQVHPDLPPNIFVLQELKQLIEEAKKVFP